MDLCLENILWLLEEMMFITYIYIGVMSGEDPDRLVVVRGPESSNPVMAPRHEVVAMRTTT